MSNNGTSLQRGPQTNGQVGGPEGEEEPKQLSGEAGTPRATSVGSSEAQAAPSASAATDGLPNIPHASAGETSDNQEQQEQQMGQQVERQQQEQGEQQKVQYHEENKQQQQQFVKRRRMCEGCERPVSVCYCHTIQGREVSLRDPAVGKLISKVLVIMHPLEKKRKNGSIQILQRLVKGMEVWTHRRPGCCPFTVEQQQEEEETQHAATKETSAATERLSEGQPQTADAGAAEAASRSKEHEAAGLADADALGAPNGGQQQQRQPQQHLCTREGAALVDTSNMLLLFPTEDSFPLTVGALPVRLPVTLLVIDGTWKEAKEMLSAAPWLQHLPAVHLPMRPDTLPLHTSQERNTPPSAGLPSDTSPASCSDSKSSATEALRVSGVYGLIRTPPARIAASGGVCTAEAVAETLATLGRWGRSTCSSLLQINTTTKETLQHIVSQQQRHRTRRKEGT